MCYAIVEQEEMDCQIALNVKEKNNNPQSSLGSQKEKKLNSTYYKFNYFTCINFFFHEIIFNSQFNFVPKKTT